MPETPITVTAQAVGHLRLAPDAPLALRLRLHFHSLGIPPLPELLDLAERVVSAANEGQDLYVLTYCTGFYLGATRSPSLKHVMEELCLHTFVEAPTLNSAQRWAGFTDEAAP